MISIIMTISLLFNFLLIIIGCLRVFVLIWILRAEIIHIIAKIISISGGLGPPIDRCTYYGVCMCPIIDLVDIGLSQSHIVYRNSE